MECILEHVTYKTAETTRLTQLHTYVPHVCCKTVSCDPMNELDMCHSNIE